MGKVYFPANKRGSARNLLRVFELGTEQEKMYGRTWYASARAAAYSISRQNGLPLQVTIAAMAALSPQTEWQQSLAATEEAARSVKAGLGENDYTSSTAYGTNRRKAHRILSTLDVTLLKGKKVEPFAANIGGQTDVLTVDSHHVSAWTGFPDYGVRFGDKVHRRCERHTRIAARRVGMKLSEFQAAVWNIWKRIVKGMRPFAKRFSKRLNVSYDTVMKMAFRAIFA